jgi:elongator complex protein 2
MITPEVEFIAAGGNRHPAAADWDIDSGLHAFGADRNVALWYPLV